MKKKAVLVGLILTMAVVVLFGAAPALAATEGSTDTRAEREAANIARLEELLKREQTVLAKQQERLAKAEQLVSKIEEWVEKLQDDGTDTSSLEAALEDFEEALDEAEDYLTTASDLLATPAGFDDDGQVTDRKQALKTVRDAGKAQRQFHLTITKATTELRKDIHEFREGLR